MKRSSLSLGFGLMAAALAFAQAPLPAQPAGPPQPQGPVQDGPRAAAPRPAHANARPDDQPPPPQPSRSPLERALHAGPRGRWWNNSEIAQKLGLTSDQVKRMDDIFQQNRLKLIDLNANVQREEVIMEPLVASDQPDEGRILAQIDKVAQARAELEKANARFLLGIRRVLNADQWKKLQAEEPPAPEPARARR
jgi:Spy/CpxP family protein refolding chaperone